MSMTKLPIAIQLYSVRESLEKDFEGTLRQIREFGYDGVEFASLQSYGIDFEDVKAMCAKIGLEPISAHILYDFFKNDPEGTVASYAAIGCKYLGIPVFWPAILPGGENYEQALKTVKNAADACKRYGCTLQYHNHSTEFAKIDGKYILDVLFEDTADCGLNVQLDTAWACIGGANPMEYIRKYAGRIPTVHLKDFAGKKDTMCGEFPGADAKKLAEMVNQPYELRPIGQGVMDITALISAAEECGTKWLIVEQDSPSKGKTDLECAKESAAFLKQH